MSASQLTKPAANSLVIRRTFDAPVERVFDAWLSPDAMRVFLSGTGTKVLDVKVDARVGGSYAVTWDQPDGAWVVGGVYKDIVKNERIVCTWTWEEDDPGDVTETLLTLEFHPLEEHKTELVLTHVNLSSEKSRDAHAEGWQSGLEGLAKMLAPPHRIGTREEWLAERMQLLKDEKEHTRRSDELAKRRQALPWVRIDKEYRFETEDGPATLADLFRGNSQLLVYHFMFGEDYTAGCPSCSSIADGFNGIAIHLAHHDVTLCAVSRAPIEKLAAYKRRMGWTFPWASSYGSDFNLDFQAGCTEAQQRSGTIVYNFVSQDTHASLAAASQEWARDIAAGTGTDWATYIREQPGVSAFVLKDGQVYHTYSAYARGVDGLWAMYQWLDRAPLGRNEDEPGLWWKRHDEY